MLYHQDKENLVFFPKIALPPLRPNTFFCFYNSSHCYFTRLNLTKMVPFYFYFPVFLGINRHPQQKDFLNSCEGFLRAALTGHSHPSPFWKIAKMALFNPCMKFEVLRKCHFGTLSKIYLRLRVIIQVDKSG